MMVLKFLEFQMELKLEELEEICHETVRKNDPYFESNDEHRLLINVKSWTFGNI